MALFEDRITVARPVDVVFDFLTTAASIEKVSAADLGLTFVAAPEKYHQGAVVKFQIMGMGQVRTAVHEVTEFDEPTRFVERQVEGDLKLWVHEHCSNRTATVRTSSTASRLSRPAVCWGSGDRGEDSRSAGRRVLLAEPARQAVARTGRPLMADEPTPRLPDPSRPRLPSRARSGRAQLSRRTRRRLRRCSDWDCSRWRSIGLVALVLPQVAGLVLVLFAAVGFFAFHYIVWGWWLPKMMNRDDDD